MATIALGAVGSLLGPVGGIVGSAIGGYIDSNFIIPGLLGTGAPTGPRLNEIRIQSAEEGSPANIVLGPYTRVAGTVIWHSQVIAEEVDSGGGGGKGGGGGSDGASGYNYFVDIAIAFAIQNTTEIRKIIAEGKLVYDSDPDVSLASSLIQITAPNVRTMRLISSDPDCDLTKLRAGFNAVIGGAANGANNGSFNCFGSSRNPGAGTTVADFRNPAAIPESAGASITITQDLPEWDESMVSVVRTYNGAGSQIPDELIEAYEGAGNVPGFNGTTYIVMNRLFLGPYGNRVPNINALIEQSSATPAAAITTLMGMAGRSSSDYDVTALTGAHSGYAISGPQPVSQALQPILLAYDIVTQDRGGKLHFFHRRDAQVFEISSDDLACRQFGDDSARPVTISDPSDVPLPARVIVNHLDSEFEASRGSTGRPRGLGDSNGVLVVDIPMMLTGGQAAAIENRILWTAHANRKPLKLTLPFRYVHLQENDCIRFKAGAVFWFLIIRRVDVGANFVLEVEATVEQRHTLTQPEDGDSGEGRFLTGINTIPPVIPDVRQPPTIKPGGGQVGVPTVSVAAAIEQFPRRYPGSICYVSDDGTDLVPLTGVPAAATIGATASALAAGPVSHWDRINTVDVYLENGELESREEIDVLQGHNLCMIGTEVLGFASASLIGDRTYRLSTLLRGLRDSTIASHSTGARFTLANSAVKVIEFSTAQIGTTKQFKIVPSGGSLADATEVEIEITGQNLIPFSPAQLQGFRDDDGNLTIKWKRRTRAVVRCFAEQPVPVMESFTRFVVEILLSGSVVRTVTVNDATEYVYAEAAQTTDGITHFVGVNVKVYQISEVMGRGKALEGTI